MKRRENITSPICTRVFIVFHELNSAYSMAKFHSYYVLCPLIDQKSFLGVSRDKDEENVLVTLGRNVVNKHRLSDQKQIGGWTSKDHITSPVVYDREQGHYVGVFNNNTIKTWQDDTENLEKLKKYKFLSHILKLIVREEQSSLIVFTNGNSISLTYGLENRKTIEAKSVIKNNETITDAKSYRYLSIDYMCYIIKNNQDMYEIISSPLRTELGDLEKAKLNRVKMERDETDVYVVGKLISVAENPVVYVLWSDSKMTVYDLINKSWKTMGTVPWISSFSHVSLAWMGHQHLILFGSNIDQDGAIIVAYNTSLGVGSCRYPMKMYTQDAKLYCFNGRIVLESSNHIGMLPYVVETSRSLSSLLGSHEIVQDGNLDIAEWGQAVQLNYKVSKETKELLQQGLTERNVCSQVILPLLEKNDFTLVVRALKEFKDVPESVLVMLLSYCIKILKADSVDVSDGVAFLEFCSIDKAGKGQKLDLLNSLFQLTFSDALLIPYLRNALTLNNALFLLTYISFLLMKSDMKYNSVYESKLFDWCTLLMDAFYQQYLMTKDEKVTYVLEKMRIVVDELINNLMVINSSLPLFNKVMRGKIVDENDDALTYSIELMQI